MSFRYLLVFLNFYQSCVKCYDSEVKLFFVFLFFYPERFGRLAEAAEEENDGPGARKGFQEGDTG